MSDPKVSYAVSTALHALNEANAASMAVLGEMEIRASADSAMLTRIAALEAALAVLAAPVCVPAAGGVALCGAVAVDASAGVLTVFD